MAYNVEIKKSAKKSLLRLPSRYLRQVANKLDKLAKNPRGPGCIKLTDRGGEHRADVGAYRILYYIDDDEKRVFVTNIRNRKDAYRRKR